MMCDLICIVGSGGRRLLPIHLYRGLMELLWWIWLRGGGGGGLTIILLLRRMLRLCRLWRAKFCRRVCRGRRLLGLRWARMGLRLVRMGRFFIIVRFLAVIFIALAWMRWRTGR